jgi:hypothetical protein
VLRRLIAVRKQVAALGITEPTTVLHADYPLVYLRGERHVVIVNPLGEPASADITELAGRSARLLEGSGVEVRSGQVRADRFGYGIFELTG